MTGILALVEEAVRHGLIHGTLPPNEGASLSDERAIVLMVSSASWVTAHHFSIGDHLLGPRYINVV